MFEFEQYTFEYKYFMMCGDIANMLTLPIGNKVFVR